MNAEPDSPLPHRPALTPSAAPVPTPAPEVSPTPTADIGPDESITQSDSGPAPMQESGLPLSPPVKLPGFENIETLLTANDLRTRGVGILMIQEQVRLREVIREKAPFEQKFYEESKTVAVLQEQLSNERVQNAIKGHSRLIADIWFGLSMCAAGFFASHADTLTNASDAGTKREMYFFAVVAVVAGVFTKWWAK